MFTISVKAQGDTYTVTDKSSGMSESFSDYDEAYDYYEDNLEQYDNLVLRENDEVIQMEYGIVQFKTGNACSLAAEYRSETRNTIDYINGCLGVDGAYLGSSSDLQRVYFMLSADKGYTDRENVILRPIDELDVGISYYTSKNGNLVHNIKSQLDYDFYSFSISLGKALSQMSEDTKYYSYDGHYFYDDVITMLKDYYEEIHDNAINEEPYYNYYQYLPYRSISNYSSADAQKYFDSLGIDKRLSHYTDFNSDQAADEVNRSQLFDQADNFFAYQYLYGTNGMMLLSSAINESSYGKSYQSFVRNNLFIASAYESEKERNNNRYDSVDNSIYAYAKYFISSMYSNHMRDDYRGTFFGNKSSGINANYSLDPYYGEKVASTYYELDTYLGNKDHNSYALGIIEDKDRVNFYRDEDLDSLLFSLEDISCLSFVVLEETEDAYKISVDSSFSDEYLYDFEKSVAYVPKDYFDFIINEDKIRDYSLERYGYNFDGGLFHDYDSLIVKYPNDYDFELIKPEKAGYEFTGYDSNLKAEYRKIESIELVSCFDEAFVYNEPIDFKNCYLKVKYSDGENVIPITSDYVSGYDTSQVGKQIITIEYCGLSIEKEIEVSDQKVIVKEKIAEAIANEDYDTVKSLVGQADYPFTFNDIRNIDYYLMNKNERNYVIHDETERYNLSISGLDLSLKNKSVFNFVNDTYYVIVKDIDETSRNKIYDLAKGYGFSQEEGIDISFRFNYEDISLDGPAIVQIDLKDKKNNLVYSVYHLSDDGDIIKCRTTQSENYIQFLIYEDGSYLVLSMPSVNEFDIADNTEDLSYENMGFDNHRINVSLMIVVALALIGIIGIIVYYIFDSKRKKIWKDFRKSLHSAGYVQEEKQKN